MTVVEDQAENIRMLHDPEPKRIFLWRGAAKQRPAFHAQCSKPLLINKLAGSGLKVRPNRAVTPIGSAFKKRLDCRVDKAARSAEGS